MAMEQRIDRHAYGDGIANSRIGMVWKLQVDECDWPWILQVDECECEDGICWTGLKLRGERDTKTESSIFPLSEYIEHLGDDGFKGQVELLVFM